MAKLKAGRLGREVSDSCLQYWGGMGFMWDNPVARAYRDVRWCRSAAVPTKSCWASSAN
jgi:alkylation response protein AidB-like acyl-CoA dehydrogenase